MPAISQEKQEGYGIRCGAKPKKSLLRKLCEGLRAVLSDELVPGREITMRGSSITLYIRQSPLRSDTFMVQEENPENEE